MTWQESYKFPGEEAGCMTCLDLGVVYVDRKGPGGVWYQAVKPCPDCAFGEQKEQQFRDWKSGKVSTRKDDRPRNVAGGWRTM